MNEKWQPLPDRPDLYEISNTGKVRSKTRIYGVGNMRRTHRGRELKIQPNGKVYIYANRGKTTIDPAQLVAELEW